MSKTKQEWLFQLRKFSSRETLDKVIERNTCELTDDELESFYSAADHRLAEIITGQFYDKVPVSAWSFVR